MTSREQFEAWLCDTYGWGEGALDSAFYQGDYVTGYYIGGDYIYDGFSCNDPLFWVWRGWQASREAVEIELPALSDPADCYCDVYTPAGVISALRTAGVKVKED